MTTMIEFSVWKTVVIPANKSKSDLLRELHAVKMGIDDDLDATWYRLTYSDEPTREFDLVVTSVSSLVRHENKADYEEICRGAKGFGLEMCPQEIALATRLSYADQPELELLIVCTEVIEICAEKCLPVLHVIKGGCKYLGMTFITGEILWDEAVTDRWGTSYPIDTKVFEPDCLLVFVKPRNV